MLSALAGVLALAVLAACEGPRARVPAVGWGERWAGLAHDGPRWHAGTEFVVVTCEGRPGGALATRERWSLLQRDSVAGQFEYQREGEPSIVVAMRFHPRGPSVVLGDGGAARGRYAYATGLEKVKVPAGSFRCGRTWRTVEESA